MQASSSGKKGGGGGDGEDEKNAKTLPVRSSRTPSAQLRTPERKINIGNDPGSISQNLRDRISFYEQVLSRKKKDEPRSDPGRLRQTTSSFLTSERGSERY